MRLNSCRPVRSAVSLPHTSPPATQDAVASASSASPIIRKGQRRRSGEVDIGGYRVRCAAFWAWTQLLGRYRARSIGAYPRGGVRHSPIPTILPSELIDLARERRYSVAHCLNSIRRDAGERQFPSLNDDQRRWTLSCHNSELEYQPLPILPACTQGAVYADLYSTRRECICQIQDIATKRMLNVVSRARRVECQI